ncbi:hypothetical protein ACTD5D_06580 [Nocardia takedensis]|uniref:hypothetical protein n=1 Tax=Nocardia takedensis TaxID=259390 RepID=UPI0002F9C770
MLQDQSVAVITDHIATARYATYLAPTGGDDRRALALYRWNIEMSGALQEATGIAEVFLRNAMDAQLRRWNAAQPPRGTLIYNHEWVRNPAGSLYAILNPNSRRKLSDGRTIKIQHVTYNDVLSRAQDAAHTRLPGHRRHGHPIDHDDIVAHMNFGTWTKLLPRKDLTDSSGIGPRAQRTLWIDALDKAFPNHSDPLVVRYWVERLHKLRNRVAHLEPLCDTDVMGYHRTVARLLNAIEPSLGSWYSGISRVPMVYRQKPVP